jgi:Dyp-type peroxidase family
MTSAHRRRLLGDHDDSAPERWDWGGARPELGIGPAEGIAAGLGLAPPAAQPQQPRREGEVEAGGTRQVWGDEIDMLLMLYARTSTQLDEMIQKAIDEEAKRGVTVFKVVRGSWLKDNKEHFGFADGIAQPGLRGLGRPGREANRVAAGEVLLGHRNEYGKYPLSPRVRAASPLLPDAGGGPGRDFGRDGTYLVMRQLEQDVPAFWAWVKEAADRLRVGEAIPGDDPRVTLASKMVGRWPSGAPLALCPKRDEQDKAGRDDFGYAKDPHGHGCPLGAHVRRTNPRDWLLGDDPAEAGANSRRHRLLRRGRTYGPALVESMETLAIADHPGDGVPRGLLFVCLNADIGRQFEFVQHTWVNNPKFKGLYEDPDPLMGAPGRTFTVQAKPVRRRVTDMPSFVQTRGGAYLFLPGVRALRYVAGLAGR